MIAETTHGPETLPRASGSLLSLGTSPSRSSTLPWQQRPASTREPHSRPSSLFASDSDVVPKPDSETSEPSKHQISQALGSKDPSWFRQTPDRAARYAGYKKDPVAAGTALDISVGRRKLPGLSSISSSPSANDLKRLDDDADQGEVLSVKPGGRPTTPSPHMSKLELSMSAATSSEQQTSAHANNDRSTPSSAPDLTPSTRFQRPVSPTKGMGGFVQSAMLRRTDSITKRWSAQGDGNPREQASITDTTDERLESPRRLSTSKSMPKLVTRTGLGIETKLSGDLASPGSAGLERLRTAPSSTSGNKDGVSRSSTPPSPSKKWSPVKSTWLESALTRPESPKPQTIGHQPAWLSELSKTKQRTNSKDKIDEDAVKESKSSEILSSRFDTIHSGTLSSPIIKEIPTVPKSKPAALLQRPASTNLVLKNDKAVILNPANDNAANSEKSVTLNTTITRPKASRVPVSNEVKAVEIESITQVLEFQNAFGKLRRTQAEKYVAPNELRDNISRGKAALTGNETSTRSSAKDETKDALLPRKELLKPKPPVLKSSTQTAVRARPDVEQPVKLGNKPIESEVPRDRVRQGQGTSKESADATKAVDDNSNIETEQPSETLARVVSPPGSKLANRFNPALASILAKRPVGATLGRPSAMESDHDTNKFQRLPKATESSTSEKLSQLQHMTKGRARGPKRRLPTTHAHNVADEPLKSAKPSGDGDDESQAELDQNLRAKSTSPALARKPINVVKRVSLQPLEDDVRPARKPALPATSSRKVTPLQPITSEVNSRSTSKPLEVGIKSTTPSVLKDVLSSPSLKAAVAPAPIRKPMRLASATLAGDMSTEIGIKRASTFPTSGNTTTSDLTETIEEVQVDSAVASVRNISAQWGRRTISGATPPRVKSPIRLPTRADEEAAMERAGISSDADKAASIGLGLSLESPARQGTVETPRTNTVRLASPLTTPTSSLPDSRLEYSDHLSPRNGSQTSLVTSDRSPIPQTSEACRLFEDFFDNPPVINGLSMVDAQAILEVAPSVPRTVKTLHSSISQLTGDGQTVNMPTSELYILDTNSMYICTHIFAEESKAKVTELYMWIGNALSESTTENAKTCARKIARDRGASLVICKQGKETAGFLQALNGTLVVRHSSFLDGSRSLMLCGRQVLGHIVFDEVKFSMSSLCSGYMYLVIPIRSTTTYLWKGSGSAEEELESARRLAVKLASSHALVDVDDSFETSDFLNAFPGSTLTRPPQQIDYWKLKPKHSKFAVRLFRVVHEAPAQPKLPLWKLMTRRPSHPDLPPAETEVLVSEITPFSQEDLEPENVYVLDVFFELYV